MALVACVIACGLATANGIAACLPAILLAGAGKLFTCDAARPDDDGYSAGIQRSRLLI